MSFHCVIPILVTAVFGLMVLTHFQNIYVLENLYLYDRICLHNDTILLFSFNNYNLTLLIQLTLHAGKPIISRAKE